VRRFNLSVVAAVRLLPVEFVTTALDRFRDLNVTVIEPIDPAVL
jgi:hypothetical protein